MKHVTTSPLARPAHGLAAAARIAAASGIVVAALVAAGCGGSHSDAGAAGGESSADGEQLTTVKVGVLPIGTQVPIYLGIEQGFFRQEGLELEMQVMTGGSAVVPAVLQGGVQFGFANGATIVFGAERRLPIKVVAGGEGAPARGRRDDDLSRVVVKHDSPIRTPEDLEGKTISVSGLRDAPELLTRVALTEQGVDVSGVKFLEVPYVDMLPALDSGRVDAAYLVTPFGEQALAAGDRMVLHPYYDSKPGLSTAYYITSKAYAEQEPEVVAAFQRALLRSLRYANDHTEEARALLPSFTKISADIIPEVNFGEFPTTTGQAAESLRFLAERMAGFGWIRRVPDVQAMMFGHGGAR